MHNSKLLTLIQGLQQEEIHWFQKFLKSPFYNTNVLYIELFDYIRKYYPELTSPKLSKEVTCQKLFPKEKVNIQKIRKAMHGLAILMEEFLVAMQVKKKPFEKKKLLVTELGERNVYTLFEKGTRELIGELDTLPYRNAHYYREIHTLNLEYYGHYQTNKQKGNAPILKTAVDYLDYYYIAQKQRLDFAIKWQEKVLGAKFDTKTLEQSQAALQGVLVYKLYALIIEAMSTTENDELYLRIEHLFKKEIELLAKNDQSDVFRSILNHLTSQINKGKEGYQTMSFSLLKFGLEKNLLIENGQISESFFTNIASLGIVEREFEWVEHFIEKFKPLLPLSIREDTTCLSLSLLFFYKKDYPKTIDLILNRQFSKPLYTLKSKSTLIRVYLEQFILDDSYYEFLIDQTHAFEKFVRRNNSISMGRKETYINFIIFIRKIATSVFKNSLNSELFNTIKETKSVVLKQWLLNKVTSLQ